MSGGTSAGNIITDAAATYAVRTWLTTEKADAFGVISDAQLESIIGANWFNNVDDNLIGLNAWFNGTGTAAHIRATLATIGTVNFTTLAASTAMIGSGALSDGVSTADDVVIGNLGATDRGVSILSTGVGRLAFVDTAATLTGYVAYTHATDTLSLGVAGATEVNLTAAAFAPHADNGLTLGDASHRFSAGHVGALTAYSSLTLGDATGSPVATFNRDTAGTSDVILAAEGVTQWRLRHAAAGGLSLDRYAAGVYADSVTFATANGDVGLPADLIVGVDLDVVGAATCGSLGVDGTVTVGGATLAMTAAVASMTIGSGATSGTLHLNGADTLITFKDDGEKQFEIACDGSLSINRYDGGVFKDSFIIDGGTGEVTVPHTLTVGSAAASAATLAVAKDGDGEGYLNYVNEGVTRWSWIFDTSEDLTLRRYNSGGSYQDLTTISNSTGAWVFPVGIGVSGTASRFTAGAGAPSGGSNGDLYWRTGGTRNSCLYYRTAGAWEALLT